MWSEALAAGGALSYHQGMDVAATYDPRNLIREAYRMEGLSKADCRSIFLDWALGLEDPSTGPEAAKALLAHYADQPADHPMSQVLREGATPMAPRSRRAGGAAGRRR